MRLHEERNWNAFDMTHTVDNCTVANVKLTVHRWKVSRVGENLKEPKIERGTKNCDGIDLNKSG